MRRFPALQALLLVMPVVAAAAPSAQVAPDPGEALYRVGRQLLSEGKTEPALRKFVEAAIAAPNGPYADDALLAAAEIDYPVSDLSELGSVGAERIERARSHLVKITTEYSKTDSAPKAVYRLGLLEMDPSNPKADLDEAFATFLGVGRLYPQSAEAAEAIFVAGECHRLQGALAASVGDDATVLLEHSASTVARRSRLRLAEGAAILGETRLARLLLRALTASPAPVSAGGSEPTASSRARSLLALITRCEQDRPEAPGSREFDGIFPTGAGRRDIAAIAADRQGGLFVLDGASGRIIKAWGETSGAELSASAPTAGVRGFVLDRNGRVFLWDERGILLPEGKRFEPRVSGGKRGESEPIKKIGGLSLGALGEIDIIDTAENRILRYGRDLTLQRVLGAFETRPTAIVRWQNSLFVLLSSRREIAVIPLAGPAQGSRISLKGPGWEIDSPQCLALDTLGRIYVLDDSTRSVTVLERKGERVAMLAPKKGSPDEFRSPSAIAVDGAGMIYVADRRLGRVLRFR